MTDILTPHSRVEISRALLASAHWRGVRRGVKLDMTLENNLIGRMIVCSYRVGRRKPQQVTGETVFEIADALRAKLGGKI
jgi:hypothetical protein